MDWELITRLMNCFPNSIINHNGEFIAYLETNQYFILKDCKTEKDIQCKVLEWLSRSACKTESYENKRKNRKIQKFMLDGINQFLGTNFFDNDMYEIYTHLGNACCHEKTLRFIDSGYDMRVLVKEDTNNANPDDKKEMV